MRRTPTIAAFTLAILLPLASGFSFDRVSNHTSVLEANGFAFEDKTLWVASSGGLYRLNRADNSSALYADPPQFPDPELTAICQGEDNSLWIGSRSGYLYHRLSDGRQTVYSPYVAAEWRITALRRQGKHLIVGSSKGCSVFDTRKFTVLKNATNFGPSFPSPKVNAIELFQDTLFLGGERGVIKLAIDGSRLEEANFHDPSIWTLDTSSTEPVKSFIIQQHCVPLSTPGTLLDGKKLTATTAGGKTTLNIDGVSSVSLPSAVTTMITDTRNNECLIGTRLNCFLRWDGTRLSADTIPGPTFTTTLRVFVDHQSTLWTCPLIGNHSINPWWEGISAWRNGSWSLFSPVQYPAMGWFTGNPYFRGVAEDRLGRMWFGTPGGQVKRYDRATGSWSKFCVFSGDDGGGQFLHSAKCPEKEWGKCDAIACDSTGFLWLAAWNNDFGSLICYDPSKEPNPQGTDGASRHYRRLWPAGDPLHSKNIGCLHVDGKNRLFVGSDDGKLIILTHAGNPLTDQLTIKRVYHDLGSVMDAVSTPDGLTRIVTAEGVFTYFPEFFGSSAADTLIEGICIYGDGGGSYSVLDTSIMGITAIEAEDEHILWLGTAEEGLIRFDLSATKQTVVGAADGLLSETIHDLAIDRSSGDLWIASQRGVSRYSLGYKPGKSPAAKAAEVYPNPFSKRRHRQLVFENLPAGSTLQIYTAAGTFVAALSAADSSPTGAVFAWNPPKGIVPGLYFYLSRAGGKSGLGKFIVTP